ncbi:unnamed protein product [Cutaneotrichosporon oleaginosum]
MLFVSLRYIRNPLPNPHSDNSTLTRSEPCSPQATSHFPSFPCPSHPSGPILVSRDRASSSTPIHPSIPSFALSLPLRLLRVSGPRPVKPAAGYPPPHPLSPLLAPRLRLLACSLIDLDTGSGCMNDGVSFDVHSNSSTSLPSSSSLSPSLSLPSLSPHYPPDHYSQSRPSDRSTSSAPTSLLQHPFPLPPLQTGQTLNRASNDRCWETFHSTLKPVHADRADRVCDPSDPSGILWASIPTPPEIAKGINAATQPRSSSLPHSLYPPSALLSSLSLSLSLSLSRSPAPIWPSGRHRPIAHRPSPHSSHWRTSALLQASELGSSAPLGHLARHPANQPTNPSLRPTAWVAPSSS